MAFMSLSSVTIEFADALETFYGTSRQPPDGLVGLTVRVVESRNSQARAFMLEAPGLPRYQFTSEETQDLLQLSSQITIAIPWRGEAGKDGEVSELTLQGAMSHITFSWWGNPPAEWQSVAAVYNYVLAIVRRYRVEHG